MPLVGELADLVLTDGPGLVPERAVDMKTEGNSLIGRPNSSNSRWKPAALRRVIRSPLPLYGVNREPYPVS